MSQESVTAAGLSTGLQSELVSLLRQAQAKTHHCVGQLAEQQIWWRPAEGLNSIGNLILHVCGNLRQWVTDGVTQRVNDRNRPAEFAATGGMRGPELLQQLDDAVEQVIAALADVGPDEWLTPRSIQGFQVTVLGAVLHSIPHFVGHCHQIVLLTRLQLQERYQMHWQPDGNRTSVPI